MQHAASAITAPDTGQLPVYWQFHDAVTRAQLTQWLPSGRHLLVDVSGPRGPGAELAAQAGHTVMRVFDLRILDRDTPRRGAEGVLGGTVSPQDREPRGGAGGGGGGPPPPPPRRSGGIVPPRPAEPAEPAGPDSPADRRLLAADLPG